MVEARWRHDVFISSEGTVAESSSEYKVTAPPKAKTHNHGKGTFPTAVDDGARRSAHPRLNHRPV